MCCVPEKWAHQHIFIFSGSICKHIGKMWPIKRKRTHAPSKASPLRRREHLAFPLMSLLTYTVQCKHHCKTCLINIDHYNFIFFKLTRVLHFLGPCSDSAQQLPVPGTWAGWGIATLWWVTQSLCIRCLSVSFVGLSSDRSFWVMSTNLCHRWRIWTSAAGHHHCDPHLRNRLSHLLLLPKSPR